MASSVIFVSVLSLFIASAASQESALQSIPALSLDLQTDELGTALSRWGLGGDAEVQDDTIMLTRGVQVSIFMRR